MKTDRLPVCDLCGNRKKAYDSQWSSDRTHSICKECWDELTSMQSFHRGARTERVEDA